MAGATGLRFLFTEAGVTYVVTDKITGKLSVYTNPGMHYKKPFFSDVTEYKQVAYQTKARLSCAWQ